MEEDEKFKEFILYFEERDKLGIPFGMSDLREKAIELKLPVDLRTGEIIEAADSPNVQKASEVDNRK